MIKKSLIIIISLTAIFTFVFTSCDSADDDGGQGADFDETQYYTKTEVDALIAGAVTEAVTTVGDQATIDVAVADDGPKNISAVDFSEAAGPWTVPGNANFGVFKIDIGTINPATQTYLYIGPNDTDYETFPLFHDSSVLIETVPTSGQSQLYAWTDDGSVTPTTNEYQISCLYWIK